jgi:RNA polymerase sigma factor (TIGR02999 family)
MNEHSNDTMDFADPKAAAELYPQVYNELRRLAASKIANEQEPLTFQPTDLVNEAFLRLIGPANENGFANIHHFVAAATEAMRRIMVDHVRRRQTMKRGGHMERKFLGIDQPIVERKDQEVLEVHEIIDALAQRDQKAAELVKLRFFSGLTLEEAASLLDISPRTAANLWSYAKAWLEVMLADSCHKGTNYNQ